VDIKDFNLPLLDEPMPPIMGQYSKPHTKKWAAKIGYFDGYLFVTPEYNHGVPGALKSAIGFLFREWNEKAAGFLSYSYRSLVVQKSVADFGLEVIVVGNFDTENRPALLAAMGLLGWSDH